VVAQRRMIKVGSFGAIETPLLVPSFSSKAAGDIVDVFQLFQKYIPMSYLISAYDIHYTPKPQVLQPIAPYPKLVILDSGGYEAAKDAEVVGPYYGAHEPRPWDEVSFAKVIDGWDNGVPTALVNYDHPNVRLSLKTQIENSIEFFRDKPGFAKTFLIKPESVQNFHISVEAITKEASSIAAFDILGLTERELGSTFVERVRNVRRVREVLSKNNVNIPIHVFGNLDPITSPIYFAAGADIFDGLNWLRYSMLEGGLEYLALYTARTLPDKADGPAYARICRKNLDVLEKLRRNLLAFAETGSFASFGEKEERIAKLAQLILGEA
jgi:hypothetical protein